MGRGEGEGKSGGGNEGEEKSPDKLGGGYLNPLQKRVLPKEERGKGSMKVRKGRGVKRGGRS